jgi:hypothetical protein
MCVTKSDRREIEEDDRTLREIEMEENARTVAEKTERENSEREKRTCDERESTMVREKRKEDTVVRERERGTNEKETECNEQCVPFSLLGNRSNFNALSIFKADFQRRLLVFTTLENYKH